MVFTRKFSEFPAGTLSESVGLAAGANTRGPGGGGGSGSVTTTITGATAGLAVGKWVRVNNVSAYVPGLADTAENAEIAGVVLNILSPTQFVLQQAGYIPPGTPGFVGFVPNQIYFLSDLSAGDATQTPTTTNGHVRKPVFMSDGPDSGWVICLETGMVMGSPGPIPSSGPAPSDTVNFHTISQPGNTFAIGNWVHVTADNVYSLASGANFAASQSVGVVTVNGNPNFTIQFSGHNSATVVGAVDAVGAPIALVAGTTYYLSDVVPGAISPIAPTAVGSSSKPVFISESVISGTGWVLPQKPTLITGTGTSSLKQFIHQSFTTPTNTVIPAATWTNVPGMTATITPINIANVIKISAQVNGGVSSNADRRYSRITRNGVPVGIGVGLPLQVYDSPLTNSFSYTFLIVDTPASILPQTYQIQFYSTVGNNLQTCTDAVNSASFYSLITLEEIGV
jgi:hypothetical protein